MRRLLSCSMPFDIETHIEINHFPINKYNFRVRKQKFQFSIDIFDVKLTVFTQIENFCNEFFCQILKSGNLMNIFVKIIFIYVLHVV